MSIEAHVFTAESQPIAIPELFTDMANVRLFVRVLRDFRDWSGFILVDTGDLQDGDTICGWVVDDSVASDIGAAVAGHDRESIEPFLIDGKLGACALYIQDLANVSPEEREDLAEMDGDDVFAKAMSDARLDYEAHSSAGRNDLSILLQFRLTQVIAKQCGGVWTDPVSGDYLVVAKDRWELLPCLAAYENENP